MNRKDEQQYAPEIYVRHQAATSSTHTVPAQATAEPKARHSSVFGGGLRALGIAGTTAKPEATQLINSPSTKGGAVAAAEAAAEAHGAKQAEVHARATRQTTTGFLSSFFS